MFIALPWFSFLLPSGNTPVNLYDQSLRILFAPMSMLKRATSILLLDIRSFKGLFF